MGESNINRGKKWADQIVLLTLRKQEKEIEWIKSQPSIVADIKEYEDSIKTGPEPKEKPKKADKGA